MTGIKVTSLLNQILYIENAFPEAKNFLQDLEENNDNESLHEIIPPWQDWVDGGPVEVVGKDGSHGWKQVLNYEAGHRGVFKAVDWDQTINGQNNLWPRVSVDRNYDEAHSKAYEILKKIDLPYQEILKIWSQKIDKPYPSLWVTKNYTIKKYRAGGHLGPHVDKNEDNPDNTMDWTVLIYLNDDYTGGELVFDDLDITLKPAAGSAVIFSCLEKHSVNEILSGSKAFIFLYIHSEARVSTAEKEPFKDTIEQIKSDLQR